MHPTVLKKRLQGIIHKAMAGYARPVCKGRGCNAHPEMRAVAQAIGARMANVLAAFVKNLQFKGVQCRLQGGLQFGGCCRLADHGVHGTGFRFSRLRRAAVF